MSKIENLEKELEEYFKRTENERKLTHTAVLYEKLLKNKKEMN